MQDQPRNKIGRFGHKNLPEPSSSLASPSRWPLGEYESFQWEGGESAMRVSGYLSGMAGREYQAFIPPAIANSTYRPSPETSTLAEESARAITLFDAKYGNAVGPFATIMLRSESLASSQIENLTASARSLGEAELGVEDKQNATMVVRNVRAMETAMSAAEQLDKASILDMHRALMDGTRDQDVAGMWRKQQVWIGTDSASPMGAAFVPPHHDRVPELMDDVMTYARRTDIPSMVQVALTHAQFETIHPFTDGNGRTGRALMHAMIKRRGVAGNVSIPVSAGLLTDIGTYHRALDAYREGDVDPIINLCAVASFRAIENATILADQVTAITEIWTDKVSARKDSAVWPVLDLLARRPVVNAEMLQHELQIDHTRMNRALVVLAEAGIIVGVNKHKKGKFWRSPEMLEALDAFAARAGRRQRQ